MSSSSCCVVGCKQSSNASASLHRFPMHPKRRALWVENLNRGKDFQVTRDTRICSLHFATTDFSSSDSSILKHNAVPSLTKHKKAAKAGQSTNEALKLRKPARAKKTIKPAKTAKKTDQEEEETPKPKKRVRKPKPDPISTKRKKLSLELLREAMQDEAELSPVAPRAPEFEEPRIMRERSPSPAQNTTESESRILELLKNATGLEPSKKHLYTGTDKNLLEQRDELDKMLRIWKEDKPGMKGLVHLQEADRVILLPVYDSTSAIVVNSEGATSADAIELNFQERQATAVVEENSEEIVLPTQDISTSTEPQEDLSEFNDQFPPNICLFSLKPVTDMDEAAKILHFDSIKPSRVCRAMPDFCPSGTRTATFLVDLSDILKYPMGDPRRGHHDQYGWWGKSMGGRKYYYRVDAISRRVVRAKQGEQYNFHVRRNKLSHKETDSKFTKCTFHYVDAAGKELYALISYEWLCEPFEFIPKPPPATSRSLVMVPDSDSAPFSPEDTAALEPLNEQLPEGVTVFSTQPVTSLWDAVIATQFQCMPERICTVRPQVCPEGTRTCSFLIDMSYLEHAGDLACDKYGRWGNSKGQKGYYRVDQEARTAHIVDPVVHEWDVLVQFWKYKHPDTDRLFSRTIFWQSDPYGRKVLGVITYEWQCEPFEFVSSSHKRAVKNTIPYERTAPSLIESVRHAVNRHKPLDIYHSIAEQTLSQGAELPIRQSQIYNLASRAGTFTKSANPGDDLYYPPSPAIHEEEWKELVTASMEVANDGQISDFPGQENTYVVVLNGDSSKVRRIARFSFECSCADYLKFKHICQHTLACAKLENVVGDFIDCVRNKFENDPLQLSATEQKSWLEKRRKSRRESKIRFNQPVSDKPRRSRTSTKLGSTGIAIPTKAELQKLERRKAANYTQPYHNNEPFMLGFVKDFATQVDLLECEHCQVVFPLMGVPPENVVISHCESVMENGDLTDKVSLIHARYCCLLERYPYFWKELLRIEPEVNSQISAEHRTHLKEQFGIVLM